MTTLGIDDAAERLHPVEDPSAHWSDSLYFNAWDPATDTFVMTRIAVLANARQVTAGMVVWHQGAVVYAYGRELADLPVTDWDVMQVDGLTYRMLESRQAWAVQLGDGEAQAHLEWRGTSPAVSYEGHPAGALPRAVAWGHYEQTCAVTGDLVVAGQRIRFDGLGQRDHSWGFRHWAGLQQWHWVTGFLDDGRAYNLFEVLSHEDVLTVNGYVQHGDRTDYVASAERTLERGEDGGADRFRLRLRTTDGTELEVTGERAGGSIPVRPAQDQTVVVHETPVRLRSEGAVGYGIYEHLVTAFD